MRLRRSSPTDPGILRRRHGRGFSYVDQRSGRTVDPEVRERVAHLAIPPAWRDVWICAHENGHLQATGIDDAGRLQYLYHPEWRVRRDQVKFDHMLDFAAALPAARRRVARHLRDPMPTRRRALACAFRILDLGCIRIGSEQYARRDGGVGLATLRCSDVVVEGATIRLAFKGKAGIAHDVEVRDARLASSLEQMLSRPRPTGLLAYEVDGSWRTLRSGDINGYIRDVAGPGFSAKDFRTWRATVTAAEALRGLDTPQTKRDEARARRIAAEAAAAQLGNTPTVARNAYIDPRVFEAYADGELADAHGAPEPLVLDALGSAS